MKRQLSEYLLPVFMGTVWLLSVCTACQPDMPLEVNREGAPAIVKLHVESRSQTDATTRVEDGVIKDLHILIYNSAGELIGQKYAESNPVTIDTHTASGCTIYAIANTGDSNLFNTYDIHSINQLKDLICTVSAWDKLTNGSALLMSGCKENVDIVAGTNTLKEMTVTRLAAKITLKVDIAAGSGITIEGYHIYGIPTKAYYMLRPLGTENDLSDVQAARAEDAVKPSVPSDWTSSGSLSPTTSTSINTTFYMFENRAGINTSIIQQQDKTETNAPDSAACVVIYGKNDEYKSLSWRIYLGATNTANFNIKRNCAYTYNITLSPTTTDIRVTYEKNALVWAGSNIYWDGTKLTFDEVATENSDLKQGVYFLWGSLIGIPPAGSSTPSTYYIPAYNVSNPTESTWTYSSYNWNDIYCFVGININNDTFLNDSERNTDVFYMAYKGDICRYLSKTKAISGNWRIPTKDEFGNASEYKYVSSTNIGSPNINGTFILNCWWTYSSKYGIIRFPASGFRKSNGGALDYRGTNGYCWSSSGNGSYSYSLDASGASIYPASSNDRKYGFPVRCVRYQ